MNYQVKLTRPQTHHTSQRYLLKRKTRQRRDKMSTNLFWHTCVTRKAHAVGELVQTGAGQQVGSWQVDLWSLNPELIQFLREKSELLALTATFILQLPNFCLHAKQKPMCTEWILSCIKTYTFVWWWKADAISKPKQWWFANVWLPKWQ